MQFCIILKKIAGPPFLAHAVKYASDRWKSSPFALIFLSSHRCTNENRLAESYFTVNPTLLINIFSNTCITVITNHVISL